MITKFKNDLFWNAISFGGIVVLGVLLNILILTFYDESALGVFNQVYAIFILLSQLAVGGVHLSIQYYVPSSSNSKEHISQYLTTALVSSLATGIVAIGVGYLLIPLIGKMLNSPEVTLGLYYSLWGLFFFSFNKIILSVFNGMREMKKFALFQFLRFSFMTIFLIILLFNNAPVYLLASILAFSELLLFLILIFSISPFLIWKFNKRFKKIFMIQNKFGITALFGNFLLDVNTKIDIFTLGIFLEDKWVGIYSFAATIAEGYMQFAVLLRNNINPIITKLIRKKNPSLIVKVLRENKIKFYKVLGLLGILSIAGFLVLIFILDRDYKLMSILLYAILITGFILSGGYQPFLMFFNQIGKPKIQTIYISFVCFSNIIFNFLLVPLIGVYGAAVGTALSFIFQVFLFRWLMKRSLNYTI